MSAVLHTPPPAAAPAGGPTPLGSGRLGVVDALRTLVGMELRQRLRSRGWYILLGVFFLLVGGVTLGALGLHAWTGGNSPDSTMVFGRWLYDGVLLFVLTLCLLVSPALSANAISGDRSAGTLAITQVTLVSTWQLMLGKWLAAWIAAVAFLVAAAPWLIVAAVVGQVPPLAVLAGLAMILVEFAVVTGIGVAVSAITGRTLFAVVVTYLLVAMMTIGSLIAFTISLQFIETRLQTNQVTYGYAEDAGSTKSCAGPLRDTTVPDPRRVAWLLAGNPYVVVADAVPLPELREDSAGEEFGALNLISLGMRVAQIDPREYTDCVDGQVNEGSVTDSPVTLVDRTWPTWPLGMLLQGGFLAALLWWGRRRLDTPAGRLPTGTRVA
ncbi:ABC transporter permease [Micrococcus porci]|uniref:ABC transporter permease n=1 Tax=Micrococcus TaxID=1269 RepID=UPI001CCD2C16|nr:MULTISPECIES: ABC transporter permease [Micrococcus]MCG7422747.1 ABC transporter permease [Micrococcus sp. ACRRV]UBH24731.1 ABC transporter permease [Micrococcus porci]